MRQLDSGRPTGRHATGGVPLVVHSHLRWDFVWQRPQQVLSRMHALGPVFFLEEPLFLDDVEEPRLEISVALPHLYRALPCLPAAAARDAEAALATVRALAQDALGRGGTLGEQFAGAVQWFYTPMPAPAMLGQFGELAVVYDCMDELAQFRFAPRDDMRARERLLLAHADVVFTGGRRLYEAKARHHGNVHFFGCGVDADHFARASWPHTPVPADVARLRRPVAGYFGVIDERLDYALLRRLAETRPDYSIVMVGPVVKVDREELPRLPNIHWLGQREYAELPAYAKAFDVCLMPFALNEATEFINPTKTLEYMAAGKPIVSTPVSDVVRNFTPIVAVAAGAAAFAEAVDAAASAPDRELLARGVERARASSWESTVAQMRLLVVKAVDGREARRRAAAHR